MNKLFTKIGVAMVGLAMAVGVGVAVNNGARVEKAEATATASTTTHSVVFNMVGFAGVATTGDASKALQNVSMNGTGVIDSTPANTVAASSYAFAGNGQVRGNKTAIAGANVTSSDSSKNWHLFNTAALGGAIKSIVVLSSEVDSSNYFKDTLCVSLGNSSQGSVTNYDLENDENVFSASAAKINSASYNNSYTFTGLNETTEYTYFKILSKTKFTSGTVKSVSVTVTYESYTASAFADDFLSETNDICSVWDQTSSNKTLLEAAWTKLNSINFFLKLSTAQKNILKNATYSFDGEGQLQPGVGVLENVANAVWRYDYLCQKYSLANSTFLNRSILGYAGAVNPFMTVRQNDTMPVIIIVSAVVGTIAIGGFFALSRKKQK